MSKVELSFPVTIRDLTELLKNKYGLTLQKAITAIYTLIEAGILEECSFEINFMENSLMLKVSEDKFYRVIKDVSSEVTHWREEKAKDKNKAFKQAVPTGTISVVATLPNNLSENIIGQPIYKVRDAYANVLSSAKEKIRISSPYIDQSGLNNIIYVLEGFKGYDLKVELLVRIDDRENPSHQLLMAIMTLINIFGSKIKIKNFARSISTNTIHRTNLGGAHAKLLIVDSEIAYVGSGELRDNSFNRNFEVGVVISQKQIVEEINNLFETVWQMGEEITLNYCREFIK